MELLVVIAIIGILVALLLPAIQAAREAGRRTQCKNNLKNLALACINYEVAQRAFPPGASYSGKSQAGYDGFSWNVTVLPYMEESSASQFIKQAFDAQQKKDPSNPLTAYDTQLRSLNQSAVELFVCPSDSKSDVIDNLATSSGLAASSYAAVTGSAASRDLDSDVLNPVSPNKEYLTASCGAVNLDGIMYVASRTKASRITDGLSKTMLLGERWYQMRAWTVGAYWFNARETKDANGNLIPPASPPADSCISSAKNIDADYPPNASLAVVGYYAQHKDTDRPPYVPGAPKTMQFNDLLYGSFHPGGTHFAFGDGHIEYLGDDIEMRVYVALASRDGGETESQ